MSNIPLPEGIVNTPSSEVTNAEDIERSIYGVDNLVRHYTQQQDDEEAFEGSLDGSQDTQITGKLPQGPPKKVGVFDSSVKSLRIKVLIKFMIVWFILGSLIIASFSIYWGSLYNRLSHMHNLKMLVVIEDDAITNVSPTIGEAILNLIQQDFKSDGNWKILNGSAEVEQFFGPGENVTAGIIEEVHHRNYWTATHVMANATLNQLNWYAGEFSVPPVAVQYVYESGRDPSAMPNIIKVLSSITTSFETEVYPSMASQLFSQLSSQQLNTFLTSDNVYVPPMFTQLDYRPFLDSILMAPLQVGLIFLIITSFLLFNFSGQIHAILLPHVKIPHYLIYRFIGNHISYFILALFISTVSAIYQIDFTLSIGKAGFVVFWFTTYLTMAAVGGMNENVCMMIFAHNPPFLGLWLISFVILNVSPTFSPMALTNQFYRYGYAMPIHQANEIFKVLLLNLWKGDLGLNYGILAIWIVLNTVLNPFCLKHVGKVMGKKAAAAAAAAKS
jgi:hypothetical protein